MGSAALQALQSTKCQDDDSVDIHASLPTACIHRVLTHLPDAAVVGRFVSSCKAAYSLDESRLWQAVVTKQLVPLQGVSLQVSCLGSPTLKTDWKHLAVLNSKWRRGVFQQRTGAHRFRDVRAVLMFPQVVVASVKDTSDWQLVVFRRDDLTQPSCTVADNADAAIDYLAGPRLMPDNEACMVSMDQSGICHFWIVNQEDATLRWHARGPSKLHPDATPAFDGQTLVVPNLTPEILLYNCTTHASVANDLEVAPDSQVRMPLITTPDGASRPSCISVAVSGKLLAASPVPESCVCEGSVFLLQMGTGSHLHTVLRSGEASHSCSREF